MSITLEELVDYWRGELDADREEAVEQAVFEDARVARRLQAIADLEDRLRALVAQGGLQAVVSTGTLDALAAAGLDLRTYVIDPGQVVPCSIASEDLTVVRLRGEWPEDEPIDITVEGTLEGAGSMTDRIEDVPVDRRSGEIVLVFPGDRIRMLPRSRFRYLVTAGDRELGEFGMDHTPPTARS